MTDYCDDPEEHGCGRRPAAMMIGDRLRRAYFTAMQAVHGLARVEIHLGSEALEHLRSLAVVPSDQFNGSTLFGFPIIEADQPDHISVHTVQVIA